MVLGLLAFIVLVVVGALVFIHTDTGREEIRSIANKQLASMFTGGGSIGKIDGSPFGDLIVHDVVINGPDGKPAISVKRATVAVGIFNLLKHDIQLKEIAADEVDIAVKRNPDGTFQLAKLMKPDPNDDGKPLAWDVDLDDVDIRTAHIMADTGQPDLGVIDLDNLTIDANVHLRHSGTKSGGATITATWRQKNAPIMILAAANDSAERTHASHVNIAIGGVSVSASDVDLVKGGKYPQGTGRVVINAPKAEVARLLPRVQLPGDVGVDVRFTPTTLDLSGRVDDATLVANLKDIDLDKLSARGALKTNELNLQKLANVPATGQVDVTFDVAKGADGDLPTAHAEITGHGTYEKVPRAEFVAKLATTRQTITSSVTVTGPMKAKLDAALTKAGNAIHLDSSKIVASLSDVAHASGGIAPAHGSLNVNLAASGALTPTQSLAVKGTIDGKRLQIQDLRASTLHVAIDGTNLPRQPHGSALVEITDLVRGDMALGKLTVNAKDRRDGKIDVGVTSHPYRDPWLVELAALVTPPGTGDTVTVDLTHHRIRAGNGVDWTGDTGRFVMTPKEIVVSDFKSKSADGAIAADAKLERKSGDLDAKLDIDHLILDAIVPKYRGAIDLHAKVARNGGLLQGDVDLAAKGLAIDPTKPPVDLETKVTARPGSVVVAAQAKAKLGAATLDVQLAAPRDLTNVVAWKHTGREMVKQAKLAVHAVDLAQVSLLLAQPVDERVPVPDHLVVLSRALAFSHPDRATPVTAVKPQMRGRLDGQLTITPTETKGAFAIENLQIPQVRGLQRVDADLVIGSTSPTAMQTTLTVTAQNVGRVQAKAELALPKDMTNPVEWQRLGTHALHALEVKTDEIAFDPAMLARFGITASMRGKAGVTLTVGEGGETVKLEANVKDLRGSPVAQPVGLHVVAALDGKQTTANLTMTTKNGKTTLITVDGKIPMTIDELRQHPEALKTAPITATLSLKDAQAADLLNTVGHTEITSGTLNGKIDVTGTMLAPKLVAHVEADQLKARPGITGAKTPTVQKLALDADYTQGVGGKLTLKANEDNGGSLDVDAKFNPDSLASGSATVKAKTFDMKPLLAFAPGPASGAKGFLDANVAIKGFDPRTAQITGDLHLKDARIPIAPAVGTLRKGQIDIAIDQKQIKLKAVGKLGKGDVDLDGTIGINGADLTGGQAKLTLKHVSPIGSVEPLIDSQVTLQMTRKNTTWVANVTVDKTFVKIDKTSGEALKPVGTPSDMRIGGAPPAPVKKLQPGNAPNAPPPPADPVLIAHVKLNKTQVESKEFRTTLAGALDVTLDADSMGVRGEITATSGDLDLFDRRYRVEHAGVTFDGTVDPMLSVRITYDFPDVETVTEVRGRLSKPELVLSSDPGLYSQAELLGFLLGGEPNGDPNSGTARDKAAQLGSSLVANQIAGYVKKALPFDIDVIRYEAATATTSAAITVGSWITHTLFFSFTQHVDPQPDENSSEGTLEYWFTRRLELELKAGDRNFDGADLLWRKRF
ncbi:MAG: translocation/assembly module TamB domain-containing protein [Kofleriaceae bacterium]